MEQKPCKEIPYRLILSKLKNEEMSQEQLCEFDEWYNQQEDHRMLYVEIAQMWESVRARGAEYDPDVEMGWMKLQHRISRPPLNMQNKRVRITLLTSIAVAVSILTAVFVGVGIGWYNAKQENLEAEVHSDKASYITRQGQSTVILSDGSKIWIQAGSSIGYSDDFGVNHRLVRVKGEAFFEVAHDAKKPFIVQAEGLNVKVYGTRFNVEAYPERPSVKVALVEGSVSLQYDQKETFLAQGQEGVLNRSGHSLTIAPTDTLLASVATLDRIRFENKNIEQVCRYLSKRYGIKIEVDVDIAEKYAFTFILRDESLDEILQMMSRINPITYEYLTPTELIIKDK